MNTKVAAISALGCMAGLAAGEIIGPLPYLSVADSPWVNAGLPNFSLEDFEDGLANTPNITFEGAQLGAQIMFPSPITDSVDGDDGAIDGFGNGGFSMAAWQVVTQRVPVQNGTFPTHVGFVVTDVGGVIGGGPNQGIAQLSFRVLFPGGGEFTYGPFTFGDGRVLGETGEDRFFGFTFPQGITRIQIQQVGGGQLELDHVQYGGAVPGQGVLALLGVGGVLVTRRRR